MRTRLRRGAVSIGSMAFAMTVIGGGVLAARGIAAVAGANATAASNLSGHSDIVSGTFKGFALLRQQALASRADGRPAYLAGYGLVPPAQVRLS